jgi:hypothetical protein
MMLGKFTEEDAKVDPAEFFGKVAMNEAIDMKSAPYEDKIRFLKYCMEYTDLVNAPLLSNIAFLVFGTKISDDVFADERVIFSNIEEYVDAKYDLKKELEIYGKDLLKFFLGSLRSYSVILPDGRIGFPGSYKSILMVSTFKDISKLMSRFGVQPDEIPLVFGGNEVIDAMTYGKSQLIDDFIKFVMGGSENDTQQ